MKQRELVKALKSIAKDGGSELAFVRHGGEHDIYEMDGMPISIPRHREVNERLARIIIASAKAFMEREK